MDNITHSLVGALIGQAGLKRRTGLAMPALIVGANLPDIDAACLFWLDGVEHLAFRRGITHGPIAWVLLPLLLAGALWRFDRWQGRRGKRPEGRLPVRFGWLYGLSFLSCLTHPVLDWLNSYGVRMLEPFSSRWFYGDVLFIIDVWLWALMGFAVWYSLRRERRGGEWRKPARIAIAGALAYIGVNGAITSAAENTRSIGDWTDVGAEVIASPPPIEFWERELIHGYPSLYWKAAYSVFSGSGQDVLLGNACQVADFPDEEEWDEGTDAFLFWSRAPFAERAPDGSVILRDARYYDPRARDRFSVALPEVRCEPL